MATATKTTSHYEVREYVAGTSTVIDAYQVDTMTDALELAETGNPAAEIVGRAFVVFADGTDLELH